MTEVYQYKGTAVPKNSEWSYANGQPVPVQGVFSMKDVSFGQEFKADGGKVNPDLLFAGMPDALMAVAAVLSYGAQKYEAHSWKRVDMARYEAALGRHMLARKGGEMCDEESGLLHLAHEACNILFLLQDFLDSAHVAKKEFLKFNRPPTDHKKETQ